MSSVSVVEEPTGAEAPIESTIAERPENVPEKFWNAETGEVNNAAVLESYNELERARSNPNDAEDSAEDTSASDDVVDDTAEGETEVTGLDSVLKDKGIDRSELTDELAANGELSEASYTKLAEAGFEKGVVDQFIEGNRAKYEAVQADINEVMSSVEDYSAMADWVSKNFSDAELKSYNDMVTSGDKMQAQAAVNWANGKYSDAVGDDVSLLGGDPNPASATDVFRSNAELTAVMKTKEYKTDPAFREDVARKLARSSIL